MRVLARVEEQLSQVENDVLLEDIRLDLNRVMWSIWVEAMSHIALRSHSEGDRCLALRNLSQVEDAGSLQHVIHVVNGVMSDMTATEPVRRVGEAALKELEDRASSQQKGETKGTGPRIRRANKEK
jgi:hypothetical protein